jgi:hypothetical protein
MPFESAIGAVVEEIAASEGLLGAAKLAVVRYMDHHEQGQAGDWQHALLGWGITTRTLEFLVKTHADIDIDEYGQNGPWYTLLWERLADLWPRALRRTGPAG